MIFQCLFVDYLCETFVFIQNCVRYDLINDASHFMCIYIDNNKNLFDKVDVEHNKKYLTFGSQMYMIILRINLTKIRNLLTVVT